jgi:uncharacterized protein YndB with AHSA1/START domain
MTHEFEVREEIELEATPEQVWEAISTGAGVDSWFLGHNEYEPRVGGTVRMSLPEFTGESTITSWEPGKRLVYESAKSPDGTYMAFENIIVGREDGTTVLRFVHSGILGDDWEAEYDALRVGDRMYLEKLAQYLRFFAPKTAKYNLFMPGPKVAGDGRVWSAFKRALGLARGANAGDPVRLTVDGLPVAEGVVSFVRFPIFLCARTGDGLYMLVQGYDHSVLVEHHGFSARPDRKQAERAWQAWLQREFGSSSPG